MNKKEFINELSKQLNCEKEYAKKIINLFEKNFIIGKRNKEKTIDLFEEKLKISNSEANDIYNKIITIVTTQIKNKLKYPFKNLDKE